MKKIFIPLFVIHLVGNVAGQVNLQTGSATFALPMFSWQDDKSRLNAVIGLDYNSGNGLKTNALASNVGQGWNLTAGGVITRMQIGEPDDQKPKEGGFSDLSKYPPGYLYNPDITLGCPTALTKYPIYKDKNHLYKQHNSVAADRELDHFAFQFNGKTGLFVLGKNNGDEGISIGDNKMKIQFFRDETMINQGVRTTITAFHITDEDGLIYKFSEHELTKVLKVNYCHPNLEAKYTQPEFKAGTVYNETVSEDLTIDNPYPKIINGWYLTEIKDPLTNRKITFNYPYVRSIDATSGTAFSFYREKGYSIISHLRSVTQTPAIGSIDFPDQHHVVFNYGKPRIDLNGDFALGSVDVTYKDRYISKYQLTTSYFILNRYGTPNTEYQRKAARLCLQAVTKIGVDLKADEPPYLFDYYLGSSAVDDFVPPPFFHLKDIWGFYNGNNSLTYVENVTNSNVPIGVTKPIHELTNNDVIGLCFIKYGSNSVVLNAKPGYAKNGLLKSITYPTGGSISYEYAQNEGLIGNQNTIVGGVHVSKTSVIDGGYSNNCGNPIITNYNYRSEASGAVSSLWGMEMPVNFVETKNYYEPEDKYFGRVSLLTWGCNYRYKYPGIQSREQGFSLSSRQQFWAAISVALEMYSAVSSVINIITLAISATPGVGVIAAVIIDAIAIAATVIITCSADNEVDETIHVYYNSDVNASNPLPSQFKRVEVTESSGANGKSVMEFTSKDDYAIWEPDNPSLSMQQRFAYWTYGLLKKSSVYDANGNLVKQTENLYNFLKAKRSFGYHPGQDNRYPSCKCLVKKSSSERNSNWEIEPKLYKTSSNDNDDLIVKFYQTYSGRVELDTSYERIYKTGSSTEYLQTMTEYKYNDDNYQVKRILTTQSNGDKNEKTIKYNVDIPFEILGELKDHNILAVPVATTIAVKKNGETDFKYLSETVTEFVKTGNGDIKPLRTLERRFNQPQFLESYNLYQGPNNPPNLVNYKETQTFTYNTAGNLTGMKDEGNRTISNIYDYDDKYVVASVINAEPNLDMPAYTSFETQTLGGWMLNGSSNIINTSSVTGVRSFGLTSSGSLTANLNTAKSYKLSFWANNNSITVSGNASLIKSDPVINGFTYYEYSIPQGASGITINGNASIDELRLYPNTARMRTVAYDPLIGKTSECDENNRITYYEYDGLARLRFIKDEHKNVIKMYEYNYAKKPSGCTVTYGNNAITEIYTKNNCAAGYTGSNVNYIIPANKYTSTISQADADRQAENELDADAQNYANANGSCSQIFYNVAKSQTFTKEGCDIGYAGTSVTYNVPAGRYISLVSQAAADFYAQYEIHANGQSFANATGNASCVIDAQPVWIGTGLEQCQSGHKMKQVKDENPNSSSYNQTQWIDTGEDATCTPQQTTIHIQNISASHLNVTFTNTGTNQQSGGLVTSQGNLYLTVSPGVYNISFDLVNSSSSNLLINGCSFTYSGSIPVTLYNKTISATCTDILIQY